LRKVLEELSKLIAPIMPFIAEEIYQTIYSKNDSVHLQEWPKFDKKKIDKKLIKDMLDVREIVSLGLAERDKEKIGLKWPLAKATINYSENLNKEILEIVARQLNVKKIEIKRGKEISVKLDTKLTPELEAEGYAREMSRKVQSFRKKLGLEKKDKIKLILITDDKFKEILEKQKDFLKERTNATTLEILRNVTTEKERFKNNIEFKIRDKRGQIIIIY